MKLVFAVIGLASFAFAANPGPVASACGPDAVRFDVKTDLPPQAVTAQAGKALVYVIEDSHFGATVRIGMDGAWVGANHGDSWFSFLAGPGDHHLCADWQSILRNTSESALPELISLTTFRAEAGEVYYFRVRISNSVTGSSYTFVDLTPTDRDEGQFLIASYKFSTFHSKK